MPKRIILIPFLLVLLFQSVKVSAQKDSIQKNKESYISINLLSYFNSFNPRWRLGYIKAINKKFKVGLDVAYGSKKTLLSDYGGSLGDNYRLFEVRPEFYYMYEYGTKTSFYGSLDLFYINHKDVFFNNSFFLEDQGNITYSRADYNREKYGFNIKFGFILDLNNRLKLNFYTGLGIRVKKNIYTNIVNPRNQEEDFFFFGRNEYFYKEGTRVGLNLPLGLKLLYKL